MLLSEEQKEMVVKNQGLVRYIVSNVVKTKPSDYEDMVSIGMIGLCKAVSTFDLNKETSFATYAQRVIVNEIFMQLRKSKRNNYNSLIYFDSFEEVDTVPILADSDSLCFIDDLEDQETICQAISIILNCSNSDDFLSWIAILYHIGGYTQYNIAKIFNFTQSYISRIVRRTFVKLRLDMEENTESDTFFSVELAKSTFEISFLAKDLTKINELISCSCSNIDYLNVIYSYSDNNCDGQIRIYLFFDKQSFRFLGDLLIEFHKNNILIKKSEK